VGRKHSLAAGCADPAPPRTRKTSGPNGCCRTAPSAVAGDPAKSRAACVGGAARGARLRVAGMPARARRRPSLLGRSRSCKMRRRSSSPIWSSRCSRWRLRPAAPA
jgi:hypothetical protein